MDDNIPSSPAFSADIHVPPLPQGKVDGYINDLIPVVIHKGDNELRADNDIPLVMHILGHPLHSIEKIKQEDLLSFRKLAAEDQMAESKIVTGWEIDTRRFLVKVTLDKYTTWSKSISSVVSSNTTCHEKMETLEGRLNHCGFIITLARNFLHKTRSLIIRIKNCKLAQISNKESQYLNLWLTFLKSAYEGISITI